MSRKAEIDWRVRTVTCLGEYYSEPLIERVAVNATGHYESTALALEDRPQELACSEQRHEGNVRRRVASAQ